MWSFYFTNKELVYLLVIDWEMLSMRTALLNTERT